MKKIIRLTESDLRRVVKESVHKIINEIGNTEKGQDALGQVHGRAIARAAKLGDKGAVSRKLNNTARDAAHKAYSEAEKNNLFAGIGSSFDNGIDIGYHKAKTNESKLSRIVKESVNKILREGWDYNPGLWEPDTETEDEKRKRQMNDDWRDIERRMEYYNSSYPGDSKFTQSSLGDSFANNWAGAGKKPGALAMDAQLPYEHPFTTQRGGLYKKADTSKWSEPSMKGRGYEGQNAARNFARNIRFKKDSVAGMTPYPWDTPEGYPTGRIYGDIDKNNFDDQDYFEDKIKSTDERWYKDQKDYYKRMKKLAQLAGGKRSKKDDERAFKRALKAADERPLHRKGSLNRAFDD